MGASNSKDEVTYFSTYGDQIEVVAPGEDILSLRADLTDMYAEGGASGQEPNVHIVNNLYYLADGTSMASPCAVGVAAFILAASPGISNQRVKEIMQESADDIIYPYGGDSLYSPGKDIYSGYGRVNLNSALQLLSGRLAKIDFPYENALISGNVAIMGSASGDSFQNYVLEYGEGYSPSNWTQITSSSVPVSKDTLGIWNSSGLTGRFTLRLTVGNQNQSLVHVIAGNDYRVRITSPSEGDTIKGNAEVYGYTIVPGFSHYTLQYGRGESPIQWSEITTSTRMVADGFLGSWLISFLDDTLYSLRLTVEDTTDQVYADTVSVIAKSITSGGWFTELSNSGSLSPAVGDIDGDGFNEVVVGIGGAPGSGNAGGIEVFNHNGQREPGWPQNTNENMMSSPALGDLDGDGIDDIVICSEQAGVHVYRSTAADWIKYATTRANDFWGLATPVLADADNDGHLEIFIVNDEGTVYAYRDNGQAFGPYYIFGFVENSTAVGFPCLTVADLNRDGKKEIIVGSAHATGCPGYYTGYGGIYIWNDKDSLLLAPGDYPDKFTNVYGLAIANVDTMADLEVIVFGQNEEYTTLSAFKIDGSQPTGYPIILEDQQAGSWFGNHPAIGDLEGDGILEIIVSMWTIGEARIYGWHQDGTPLGSIGSKGLLVSMESPEVKKNKESLSTMGKDIGEVTARIKSMNHEPLTGLASSSDDPVFASEAETFGSPVLVDIDGDGLLDIIVRAGYYLGSGYERVFAWDYEGNLIPGFPLYTSDEANQATYYPYTPVMTDVDKDGKLDMILVTDNNNFITPEVVCWEFDTPYDATTMHWPKYMHDKRNSGLFSMEDYGGYGISDIIYLVNYLYRSGPPPHPLTHGDVNCDGTVNASDIVYLINYLFRNGPSPC